LTDVKNEKNEEKKNETATDSKNELKEKKKSLDEQNQFYNVPNVLNTEPNEIKQNYVKIPPIIKQKQKEDVRSNTNEQSNRYNYVDKGEQQKYNFATHFINTSTTYDKNADLKNATFDEKLNNGKDGTKPKEKKLQAPLNMKKNTRKM